jgi:hypothetical protein
MRTSDEARRSVRDLYALARSTPHADEALVYVLRAMELQAEGSPPLGPAQVSKLSRDRLRRRRGSSCVLVPVKE